MALLTAEIVSTRTGFSLADDAGTGICELAVNQESGALHDAHEMLGDAVRDAMLTTDYTAADINSATAAEAERARIYQMYVASVARLAIVRIGAHRLAVRVTDGGGAQTEVGEGDRTARLLSYRDASQLVSDLRSQAEADLLAVAEAVADTSETDDIDAPPLIYIC